MRQQRKKGETGSEREKLRVRRRGCRQEYRNEGEDGSLGGKEARGCRKERNVGADEGYE